LSLGGPHFSYGYSSSDEKSMLQIKTKVGTIVSFNNTTAYHKVSRMMAKHHGERTVFGFFLVDPQKRIPDSLNDTTLNLHKSWKRIVIEWAKNNGTELPEDILKLIGTHFEVSQVKASQERDIFKKLIRVKIVEKWADKPTFVRHACNMD